MKAYLVDDEQPCLDDLSWLLSRYPDIELAGAYKNSARALEAIENDRPDVVFLDIDMPRMSGLELAHSIQARHTGVIIVFVTAYAGYALDAYKVYPLDFLVKPVLEEQLEQTVSHLRQQHALLHPQEEKHNGLNIRCFGPFEVNAPCEARFPTRRVKELLLYLIGRNGVAATRDELLCALFAGRNDQNALNNLYVTLSRLKTLLDCWDASRLSVRLTEDNALTIAPGVCDFTDFMAFAARNAALSEKNAEEAARALSLYRGAVSGKGNLRMGRRLRAGGRSRIRARRVGAGRVLCGGGPRRRSGKRPVRAAHEKPAVRGRTPGAAGFVYAHGQPQGVSGRI